MVTPKNFEHRLKKLELHYMSPYSVTASGSKRFKENRSPMQVHWCHPMIIIILNLFLVDVIGHGYFKGDM